MFLGEVTRHDPHDFNSFGRLVYLSFDELEGHGLHDKEFDVLVVNLANFCDVGERDVSLVFAELENVLEESDDADLVLELIHFIQDVGVPIDDLVVFHDSTVEFSNLAATKSLEQIVKPFKIGFNQRLKNFFVKQFSNVENFLAKENCHAELDGPLQLLVSVELSLGRVSQECETTLVKALVVFLTFVILSLNICQASVDLGVNIGHGLSFVSDFIQNLKAIVMLAQVKLLLSLTNSAEEKSVNLAPESGLSLLEEGNCGLKISELTGNLHGDNGVLERVQFHVERTDHNIVQLQEILVLI